MDTESESKIELMEYQNGFIEGERKVIVVKGKKICNSRVSAGLSIRMFANKLTEKNSAD